MRTSDVDIFFAAGTDGADADHWMSRWSARLSTLAVVAQPSGSAGLAALTQAICDAVRRSDRPAVIVAHGLGALAVARAAGEGGLASVRGGFLVNPSAVDIEAPRGPLPFPALLVASRDDPYATFEAMSDLAFDWGAHVVDAGAVGRLDSASGHGPWPEGLMRFGAFIARL